MLSFMSFSVNLNCVSSDEIQMPIICLPSHLIPRIELNFSSFMSADVSLNSGMEKEKKEEKQNFDECHKLVIFFLCAFSRTLAKLYENKCMRVLAVFS